MRHTTSPRRKPLILVVEDHDSARTALTKLLSSTGYDVVEAPNGSEALAQLATGPRPDLILLDLMMPVMDGWQFAHALRARDEGDEDIPLVLLSAARDLRIHAKALSAADIIEKPFDLSDLLPKIARVASAA